MKKDSGSRFINILVTVMLVISVAGIILMAEDGPVFGTRVVFLIFGGTVLFMMLLTAITFTVNLIRRKISRIKINRYLKKYVTDIEYETISFGALIFTADSHINAAYTEFYDSEKQVSIEIEVDNTEENIHKALGVLEVLNENFNEYFESANYAISESTGYDETDLSDVDEIRIYMEDGEMYVMLVCNIYTVSFLCVFDDETAIPKIGENPQVQPY